jgi:hypothetical protein
MTFNGSFSIRRLSKNLILPLLVLVSAVPLAQAAEESGDGFRNYWTPRLSSLIKKMDSASFSGSEKAAYDDMNGLWKANGKLDSLSGLSASDKAALKTALNAALNAVNGVNWGAKGKGASKEQIIASIEAAATKIEAATSAFSMSDSKMATYVKKYILVGMSGDMRSRKIPYVKKNGWVDVAVPQAGGYAGSNADTRVDVLASQGDAAI